MSSVIEKWNHRNTKKSALPSNQAAAAALKASMMSPKQEKKSLPILAILGAVFIFIGIIVVAATDYMIAGLGTAAVGVIFLIFGLLGDKSKTKQTIAAMPPELIELQEAIAADIAFIEKVDEELAKYLSAHGRVFDEFTISSSLQELTEEYIEYSNLKKKAEKAAESTKSTDIDSTQGQIVHFLETYGITPAETRFADDLYLLKNKSTRYMTLQDRKEKFDTADSSYWSVFHEICGFLERYGFAPLEDLGLQLSSIRDDVDDYQDALKLHGEAAHELVEFERGTDIIMLKEEISEETLPSLEELNQKILELTNRMEDSRNILAGYNKTLEELQKQYDEWEENRLKLEEERGLQKIEQIKYDHVLKARMYLSLAKESMTAKYAAPILESFSKYYGMLTGNSAENFHVDANTSVTVDKLGKQRETNTLSVGYRDLIGICLRVALVDAMYREEAPLLIMDDPFTNLDDRKLIAGKKFLEQIAKKYQVIYFTCNNARSIGN